MERKRKGEYSYINEKKDLESNTLYYIYFREKSENQIKNEESKNVLILSIENDLII